MNFFGKLQNFGSMRQEKLKGKRYLKGKNFFPRKVYVISESGGGERKKAKMYRGSDGK